MLFFAGSGGAVGNGSSVRGPVPSDATCRARERKPSMSSFGSGAALGPGSSACAFGVPAGTPGNPAAEGSGSRAACAAGGADVGEAAVDAVADGVGEAVGAVGVEGAACVA
jgi:hypothetical protein